MTNRTRPGYYVSQMQARIVTRRNSFNPELELPKLDIDEKTACKRLIENARKGSGPYERKSRFSERSTLRL